MHKCIRPSKPFLIHTHSLSTHPLIPFKASYRRRPMIQSIVLVGIYMIRLFFLIATRGSTHVQATVRYVKHKQPCTQPSAHLHTQDASPAAGWSRSGTVAARERSPAGGHTEDYLAPQRAPQRAGGSWRGVCGGAWPLQQRQRARLQQHYSNVHYFNYTTPTCGS